MNVIKNKQIAVFCILIFFLVACSSSRIDNYLKDSNSFILAGSLNVVDTTCLCANNSIYINNKRVIPDGKNYFIMKISSDTCTITSISNFKINNFGEIRKLEKGKINYIGDIEIVIAPNRDKIVIPEYYYTLDASAAKLWGYGSLHYKWYQDKCYNPSWHEIVRRGYYYSTPESISENEVIYIKVNDNYEIFKSKCLYRKNVIDYEVVKRLLIVK